MFIHIKSTNKLVVLRVEIPPPTLSPLHTLFYVGIYVFFTNQNLKKLISND